MRVYFRALLGSEAPWGRGVSRYIVYMVGGLCDSFFGGFFWGIFPRGGKEALDLFEREGAGHAREGEL